MVQTELVEPRGAGITIMQIHSFLSVCVRNISLYSLEGPSLESDVVSEVPPDGG